MSIINRTTNACPPDENVTPIPNLHDRNYCAIAGNNNQDTRMLTCCNPSPVHVTASGCFEWCEIPDRYFQGLHGNETDRGVVHADFHNCLVQADAGRSVRASLCYMPMVSSASGVGVGPGGGWARVVAVFVCLWVLLM